MRYTIQRKIVLDTVIKMHTHPTVDDIYRSLQIEHPNISKATVYRNLHLLADSKEIRMLLLPDSIERYDYNLVQHYHFHCKICGGIFDVDVEYLKKIDALITTKYGFTVDGHDTTFKGLCVSCKAVSDGVGNLPADSKNK